MGKRFGARAVGSGVLSAALVFGICVPTSALAGQSISPSVQPDIAEGQIANDGQKYGGPGYEPGKVLVAFKGKTTKKQADRVLRTTSTVEDDKVDASSLKGPRELAIVKVAAGSKVEQAAAELRADPHVAYAQPNYLYRVLDSGGARRSAVFPQVVGTNDPLRSRQWYLNSVGAYAAWDHAEARNKTTIAVLDTGIDMEHVDLRDNIVAPYDVTGDSRTDDSESVPDDSPDDQAGHGSHCAGIAAGVANNGYGIAGVSYNANVMPLRVCYYSEAANNYVASSVDIANAYKRILSKADRDANGDGVLGTYAQEYNVRVANMSLGALWSPGTNQQEAEDKAVLDLVDRADRAGILTVAAAGNDASDAYSWPSDYATCMAVIALDRDDRKASFSNYGHDKDISAPGVDIFSTVPASYAEQHETTSIRDKSGKLNYYAYMDGTSMASPLVAGVAALVFAANPKLTPEKVKDIMYATATDLGQAGRDDTYGYGKVNAEAAVRAATAIPVTGIAELPSSATAGEPLELSGSVAPADASNQEIEFSVIDAGTTGAAVNGTTFTADAAGTATLRATVVHGGVDGADFAKDFTITVEPAKAPEPKPEPEPDPAPAPDPSSVTLLVKGLAASYAYAGKAVEPDPKVYLGGKRLVRGVDYHISYQRNTKPGRASLAIELMGNYSGRAQLDFAIAKRAAVKLPATKVIRIARKKHALAVIVRKSSGKSVSGYQIRWSSKRSMSKAKRKMLLGASKTKVTLKKLKSGCRYYVQARTFKKSGGKRQWSAWSKTKSAKVK